MRKTIVYKKKEDYDDQHQSDCEFPENVSCDLPANTQPSISKITESQFTPILDDPCKWPESISDAQRCDIVKRGPHQLIMNFPYNNTTPRRRFSSNHYKRVLPNGERVSRWKILKKHVKLSIKSQSDTRWESRIKCIKPLRYNLKEVLLALKDLEAISIQRKDGRAASETKSLIADLSKWSFLLSVFIWYDILFQVNKASKILQSYGVSLHTMETEIQTTEKFLQNYRTTGYDSAATSAVQIAQELDIDPSFPPSRSGKKRKLFDYQGEEEQRATPELKFKSNFFYPLADQAMMSIKERFNLLREVSSAFSFLYTRDKLLLVQQENALLTCCKEFQKKFGDIDSDEMSAELQRFVLILQKKRNLNTAQDFLNYLLKTRLLELYPNVYIALRILLTCPVTVASAERSFSKLKLIKTFNRTSMTDSRLSSLAMLSIENDCARSLDYDNVITAFANKKVRSRLFK